MPGLSVLGNEEFLGHDEYLVLHVKMVLSASSQGRISYCEVSQRDNELTGSYFLTPTYCVITLITEVHYSANICEM